jgi:hypothetical protein
MFGCLNGASSLGTLPLLARGLTNFAQSVVPANTLREIRARAGVKALRSLAMAGELGRVSRRFEAAGLSPIAFKGPTLSFLAYGDVGVGDSTDLDIFVPRKQIRDALEILAADGYRMKTRGFKTSLPGACEVTLRRREPDCEIDLHWLFSPPYFLPFDEAGAARRSIVLRAGGLAVRTLCPEDLLLYLCVHGARVCWPFRLLCDLAGLVLNCRPDWDDVAEQAERAHCTRALRVGRLLRPKLAEIMPAAPPPSSTLRAAFDRLNREIDACCEDQRLAA